MAGATLLVQCRHGLVNQKNEPMTSAVMTGMFCLRSSHYMPVVCTVYQWQQDTVQPDHLYVYFVFIVQPYNEYETVCVGHMLEALFPLCPVENLLLL